MRGFESRTCFIHFLIACFAFFDRESDLLLLSMDVIIRFKKFRIFDINAQSAQCYRMFNMRHLKRGIIFENFDNFKQF